MRQSVRLSCFRDKPNTLWFIVSYCHSKIEEKVNFSASTHGNQCRRVKFLHMMVGSVFGWVAAIKHGCFGAFNFVQEILSAKSNKELAAVYSGTSGRKIA